MSSNFDLLIKGGTCLLPEGAAVVDLGISQGRIAEIGALGSRTAKKTIEAKGLHILPGVIDTQVHFREPGLEYKEDLESGTRSAILEGVTSIFEMPNTKPPTTTKDALEDKLQRAKNRAWCHHAFFVGATQENAHELNVLEKLPGCAGVKIFMGSSTGTLLVDQEETLDQILKNGSRCIAIHAEDEARLKERRKLIPENASAQFHSVWRDDVTALLATERIVKLAHKNRRKIHILHVSSKIEMEFLKQNKGEYVTVECLPQFLTFYAPDVYEKLGTRAQMNPPIRYKDDQEALWLALRLGVIDVLGTDHAPHTLEEKNKPYPESPSGMPGVQTLVPVMLNHVNQGRLTLKRFVELTATRPAQIYGVKNKGVLSPGYDADLTVVDMNKEEEVRESWLATKCKWSPFTGMKLKGWPVGTLLKGQIAMWEGKLSESSLGEPIEFEV